MTRNFYPNPNTRYSAGAHHGSVPFTSHPTRIVFHTPESTPDSPSSSHNSLTIAEKRQTHVSKYLISEDFKSSFANKLHDIRRRESDSPQQVYLDSSTPTPTPDQPHDCALVGTHLSPIVSTSSLSRRGSFDRHMIQEDPALPEEPLPSTSMQKMKGQGLPLLEITSPEDPELQNARYEVVRKLADQLADQMEENDHLLYELGVVRSNYARLQAQTTDKEDEIACSNHRIRLLESIIANTSSSTHDPQICAKDRSESEALIRSLDARAQQFQQALCRIQLELHKARHSARVTANACSDLDHSPFKQSQIRAVQLAHSKPQLQVARRSSWHGASTQVLPEHPMQASNEPTWLILNQQTQSPSSFFAEMKPKSENSNEIRYGSITYHDDLQSLKGQLDQLRAELNDCQEARMTSEVTLHALLESISNDPDVHRALSRAPTGSKPMPDLDRVRNEDVADRKMTSGLGIASDSIPERKALSEVKPNFNGLGRNATNGESPMTVASVLPSVEAGQHSNSPRISLFSGWGRKNARNRSSTLNTHMVGSEAPDRVLPAITESTLENAIDRKQQYVLSSPPKAEQEGAHPGKKFTLGSFFSQRPGSSSASPIERRNIPLSSSPFSSPTLLQEPAVGRSQARSPTSPPTTRHPHPLENVQEGFSEESEESRESEQERSVDSINESESADPSNISSYHLLPSNEFDHRDSGAPDASILDTNPSDFCERDQFKRLSDFKDSVLMDSDAPSHFNAI